MTFFGRGRCFPILVALFLAACAPPMADSPGNPPADHGRPAAPPQQPAVLVEEGPATPPEITAPAQSAPAARVATASPGPASPAGDDENPPAVAVTPPPAPEINKPEGETVPPLSPPEPGYESRASYYSKWFDGRPTITDEIYDPNKLTAATNDLPLGTLARVINPKNGREVIVRVNDRPRKRSYPLIDLSRAAAKKLGFYGQGLIRVRVIPLPPDAPEYAAMEKKKRKKK